jgi:hypothetical protein
MPVKALLPPMLCALHEIVIKDFGSQGCTPRTEMRSIKRCALRGESGRYALQVLRISQPEEIQSGDGHPFLGLQDIDKPVVRVFPEIAVCLDCGTAEFAVPEAELLLLAKGDAAAEVNLELSFTAH